MVRPDHDHGVLRPPTRLKMKSGLTRRVQLAVASLLILFPTTIYLQTRTPHCGHMVVITAPYHGSTPFIRGIENCGNKITTINTTLPATKIVALARRHSLKVFPGADVMAVVEAVKPLGRGVVVLRRDVAGGYRAYVEAGGKMAWEDWERSVDGWFDDIGKVLKGVDWVWYDDMYKRQLIWLERAGCHVATCEGER